MHVLLLHQNFPAQFGPLLSRLGGKPGWRFTFVSRTGEGEFSGVERVAFNTKGGATQQTHYFSRTFENVAWQSAAAYKVLKARPDIKPDLIVAHSGFLTSLPLRELYPGCPIVNFFEFFYHAHNSDLDFRPNDPPTEPDRVRARFRNAAILLDLENCDGGYSPTEWQRSLFPAAYHDKIRVIFDGVDTDLWRQRPCSPRQAGKFVVPDGVPLVTYAARGFEAMRGFDIFMRFAKALYTRRPDVRFLVIGRETVHYGGDLKKTGGKSFKDWVLSQDSYDLSKFAFVGSVPPETLAEAFSISDLHIYLTVPFVLSWSLLNALACGVTVLASGTPPVREVIEHGTNGLLADFFDVEGMADQATKVLADPGQYRPLGQTGIELVREKYSLEVCLPQLVKLFEETAARR
jgi:glycosyltransferase involved in cell wall biosynthesis